MCTSTGFLLWQSGYRSTRFLVRTAFSERIHSGFEMLCYLVETHDFGTGGLGLKNLYPHGYSTEEIVKTLEFLYRRDSSSGYYNLNFSAGRICGGPLPR